MIDKQGVHAGIQEKPSGAAVTRLWGTVDLVSTYSFISVLAKCILLFYVHNFNSHSHICNTLGSPEKQNKQEIIYTKRLSIRN